MQYIAHSQTNHIRANCANDSHSKCRIHQQRLYSKPIPLTTTTYETQTSQTRSQSHIHNIQSNLKIDTPSTFKQQHPEQIKPQSTKFTSIGA